MALGTTKVDERTFDEFLNETRRYYTAERYHLLGESSHPSVILRGSLLCLGFNCNVFTNLCALFLTGHSIPETIQGPRVHLAAETRPLTQPLVPDLPIDFVSTTIGKLTNPVIQALYRSTLHKDTLMDPNQPDFEIEEDEEQIRSVEGPSSPSSSSYGQTLASTTVGAGRAVISAGGKMVRMVVNTSSSIRGSTVG